MERCKDCGEFYFGRSCSCEMFETAVLEWDVSYDYLKGKRVPGSLHLDGIYVHARDAEAAAEKTYRERDDEPDCSEKHVAVRKSGSGDDWKIYVVQAEAVIEYHCSSYPGLGRFSLEATRICDDLGLEIPDEARPQTHLGDTYYSPERRAQREKYQ